MESDACNNLPAPLWNRYFPDDSATDKLESKKLDNKICNSEATPYELPMTHWLLEQRFDDVYKAATELGISLPRNIVYGGLPLAGVDAEVEVQATGHEPIVMIDIEFFEFSNEFAKLSALTIPVEVVDNSYDVQLDTAASITNINSNPSFREKMIELIELFQGVGTGPSIEPDPFSETVQAVYTQAIEDFAVAHELGHIYYGHPSSSFDMESTAEKIGNWLFPSKANLPLPIREIEADSFAIRILLQIRDDEIKSGQNPFFATMLSGAEFYFIAQGIMDDATNPGKGESTAQDYTPEMRAYVKLVANCTVDPGCRISEIPGLKRAFPNQKLYPPHQFRADVIAQVLADHPIPNSAGMQKIADLVNRNAGILWGLTKPEFIAGDDENRRLAIHLFQCAGFENGLESFAQNTSSDLNAEYKPMATESVERGILILHRLKSSDTDITDEGKTQFQAGLQKFTLLLQDRNAAAVNKMMQSCVTSLDQ